ncbi:dinuclear metal center protein, YbgI/SA1388 family [Halolactibacillus halophilus]|uniref:GTP cyclohydrolase 1 type 2 homolog n=1 Tax=Halolactibacillus halophilus TaxID=306540 RepID=A0A1I5KSX1_9BACI|nr:Nif3-like dinuclear metal center hexameric protein [Halolactibacillus halophilus]GEM00495.1 GTP cyclohydrolase 1 type 2 [Halolactibacillus halophilus]SFO88200.1 dinuclear metal center protein, YbgI/SA1388 family [Halolactibacillus halophilus]
MHKPLYIKEFLAAFEQVVPQALAYDWDAVGLQMGDVNTPLTGILTTLDVTEAVVDEAIEQGVNLIMSHHPIMFKPMKKIDFSTVKGRLIKKCLLNGLTIFSAHTNYDRVDGGMNDRLADRLALVNREMLVEEDEIKNVKLQVFVPHTHKEILDEALTRLGIGTMGNYEACVYETDGIGRFQPTDKADPFIGERQTREAVEEVKLEYLITHDQVSNALSIIDEVHPYETPAFDLIPLLNTGKVRGIGRVGDLTEPISFHPFIKKVKETFGLDGVRVAGQSDKLIKRVAILGGSGEKFTMAALKKQADVYITGDMTFHSTQDIAALGLNIIDAGHYLESVMKDDFKEICQAIFKKTDCDYPIVVSRVNTNPFRFI